MFSNISSRYDLTNSVLSFGIHWWWKYRLSRNVRGNSIVLDLCTGTGDLLPLLKKHNKTVIGGDFCAPMLEQSIKRGFSSGVTLITSDAMSLPFKNDVFNVVTVAFGVRNFQDLRLGLSEIKRVLAPGGKLLVLEFGQPYIPVWRSLYKFYQSWVMPYLGGLLTGNRAAYLYLPATSRTFPSGKAFLDELHQIGLRHCEAKPLSGGIAYIYKASKD
jgi:demethylmenaquinone methyltransferase/2-methoxy-6-polyprenyl-1,4-benzoquinol methylase